jgi:hypothetical protein
MATKLATYDFSKPSNLTTTERRTYPWDEWLDGNIWRLEYKDDFTAHPLMMERIIRTRATAKGAKVQLRHEAQNGDVFGIIVVQRSDIAQPKQPRARKAPAAKAAPAKKAVSKAPVKKATKPVVTGPSKPVASKSPSKKAPAKKVASKRVAK